MSGDSKKWSGPTSLSEDSSMTVTAVDRLVHHCRMVEISGESYRQRQAKARLAAMEGSLA
jgi:DNA replication protein DnaC